MRRRIEEHLPIRRIRKRLESWRWISRTFSFSSGARKPCKTANGISSSASTKRPRSSTRSAGATHLSKALRRVSMKVKPHIDFGNHERWTAYVRREVPLEEQSYVLTLGRTELFKRFHEVRGRTFPEAFRRELEQIERLNDPGRTEALASLNDGILRSLT